ncbi:hypothetical protein [Legionella cardiaca]|uniref:Uncharacterized protein n=1 Tax=Legionella cardiaca TaxID=1071983 RepID=A0ABY8AQ52_9GAMM|nr:hypothetical protein [Legionella cardiaca]WED42658.1 hypothetical protein PXX05_12225 [Legionella cardiaca]
MNQRLVWNFEINPTPPLDLLSLAKDEKDKLKWEARYFWPENTIVTLIGLNDSFLDLGNYEIKHRNDNYLLLPDSDYNIKQRRDELQYKPLLQKIDNIRAYGKKIDLNQPMMPNHSHNTENASLTNLLTQVQDKAVHVAVHKIVLIYKFPTTPAIKLELARLTVYEKIYFSVCIEGRSQLLVSHIAKHLLVNHVSCDYVNFLRPLQKS